MAFLPIKSKATDFYNVDLINTFDSGLGTTHDDFYGEHNTFYYNGETHFSEELDLPYDSEADFSSSPGDWVKTTTYTIIENTGLDEDRRPNNSLSDYNLNTRFMSNYTNFDGRAENTFSFNNPFISSNVIDSQMFYTGEFIAEPEFRTNGVRQVGKKAILSNTNAQGEVVFNLDGLQASDGDDFIQFNIHREYNDLHFTQPSNGVVAVTNTVDSSTITNGQRFIYNDMVDAAVNVSANTGHHLLGLDVVRTDINSGDRYTNSINFSDTVGSYVSNFSTNLEDLVGDNRIENVRIGVSITARGVPETWYVAHNIAVDDNANPDSDPYLNWQEWVLDTNPTNANDYFYTSISSNNFILKNSSTNVQYGIDYRDSMISGDWASYTNGVSGNNGETAVAAGDAGFYRGHGGRN